MTEACRYLTKAELAERCRVTSRTVERWMRDRIGPPVTTLRRRELQGKVACAQFQLGGIFGCWESTQNVRSPVP